MRFCPRCLNAVDAERCPECGSASVVPGGLASADPLIGSVLDNRYEVRSLLGEGAMGRVYRGAQRPLGRAVAIKVIAQAGDADLYWHRRFQREALLTSKLNHPHCIRLYDFGYTAAGAPYMVIELLDGRELFDELRRVGHVPVRRALTLSRQIASALVEAHGRGIVHRDLKPSNVFLTAVDGDDHVKVMDFGLAASHGGPEVEKLTQTGTVMGTPAYMSPEQATARDFDARTDLYSLGVMLFELLTGRVPFLGDTIVKVLMQQIRSDPPRLASLRAELAGHARLQVLVDRLLAKKVAERPDSAESVVAALDELLQGEAQVVDHADEQAMTAALDVVVDGQTAGDDARTSALDVVPDLGASALSGKGRRSGRVARTRGAALAARPTTAKPPASPRSKPSGPQPALARLTAEAVLVGTEAMKGAKARLSLGSADGARDEQLVDVTPFERDGATWRGEAFLAGFLAEGVPWQLTISGAVGGAWRLRIWCDRPRPHLVVDAGGKLARARQRLSGVCGP